MIPFADRSGGLAKDFCDLFHDVFRVGEMGSVLDRMARENPTWGEERIADELLLKLGIRVSPRTVGKYLERGKPRGNSRQRWTTFVRNHAQAIVACDFFVSITASFRVLYVFVAMEIGSRRILYTNVTDHPTAEWTIQQFREFMAFDHPYRFVLHDRDTIFSACDAELKGFGVRVLKTPVRTPKANAFCERLVGTIRRECLDLLIPLNEGHLKVDGFFINEDAAPPGESFASALVITIADARTLLWDRDSRSRPKPRFRLDHTGTSCLTVIPLQQRRFSADYTTNIGWRRRPHDGRLNYCGAQAHVARN